MLGYEIALLSQFAECCGQAELSPLTIPSSVISYTAKRLYSPMNMYSVPYTGEVWIWKLNPSVEHLVQVFGCMHVCVFVCVCVQYVWVCLSVFGRWEVIKNSGSPLCYKEFMAESVAFGDTGQSTPLIQSNLR